MENSGLFYFVEQRHFENHVHQFVDIFAGERVGEDERLARAHKPRVVIHHLERCMHIGSEVDLVYDEYIALRYCRRPIR